MPGKSLRDPTQKNVKSQLGPTGRPEKPREDEYEDEYGDYGEEPMMDEGKPVPKSVAADYISHLVGSHDIDPELRNIFQEFTSQDFVLSNLTTQDINEIIRDYDEAVITYISEIPEWEFNWFEDRAITQFRAWLKARLRRSWEGFERSMQTTQTSIQRSYQERPGDKTGGDNRNFLQKLFGGGKKESRESGPGGTAPTYQEATRRRSE